MIASAKRTLDGVVAELRGEGVAKALLRHAAARWRDLDAQMPFINTGDGCDHEATHQLLQVFHWGSTPEGHVFWSRLHDELFEQRDLDETVDEFIFRAREFGRSEGC